LANLGSGNFFGAVGVEKRRMVDVLRRENASAILCHFGQNALRVLPAAEAAGIPLVVHFHGLDISSSLNNRWYRWSLKRSLPKFAAIVCVGSQQKERLIGLGVAADRIHLIPCGVPVSRFPLSRRPPDPAGIRFICVSRLVEWKGVDFCIKAFARLGEKLPGSRLVIVGDGAERAKLETLAAELGVAKAVEFTGSQSELQVRAHFESADIFLQHSLNHSSGWFEGFGVSVAEASAMGLPVVVSACGGMLDQVVDGATGIIVPQRDDLAMSDAMLRLGVDPALRARMGDQGRERMVRHFDTELQVAKLEQVLMDAFEV
jgi:glycosyltransferase involved in cell wall biosynthesis